jgi:thiamine biosynthesis lipoprotein ApbE
VNVHRFEAMGCEIAAAGVDAAAVAAVFEEWEDAFSLFRPRSELSRVNRSDASVVAVSPLFARTLAVALDVAADTDGLVEPTLCGRVDAAAELIAEEGFVSAGGDIAVRGPVDVALPHGGAIRVVEGGLATSGTASRGRHLVDPRTGEPSNSPWEQVTASGASCLAADIAAKTAFLLGADGPAWLDARGISGRFIARDGEIVESSLWRGALACT